MLHLTPKLMVMPGYMTRRHQSSSEPLCLPPPRQSQAMNGPHDCINKRLSFSIGNGTWAVHRRLCGALSKECILCTQRKTFGVFAQQRTWRP